MKSGILTTIARYLLMISIPILLVVTPLYLFVQPGFAHWQYGLSGFPSSFRFERAERERLSDANIGLLRGTVSVEELAALQTDSGERAMIDREISHMVDVKLVMDSFFRAHGIAVIAALVAAVYLLWKRQRETIGRGLRDGVLFTAALMVVILVASVVDFNAFFTVFHQLFFTAGSWLFYVEDTLIQLYPLPFWVRAIMLIAPCVLLEAGLLWALSIWLSRRSERRGVAA
jgi:integral membrane protein (TIGR01906 family)